MQLSEMLLTHRGSAKWSKLELLSYGNFEKGLCGVGSVFKKFADMFLLLLLLLVVAVVVMVVVVVVVVVVAVVFCKKQMYEV